MNKMTKIAVLPVSTCLRNAFASPVSDYELNIYRVEKSDSNIKIFSNDTQLDSTIRSFTDIPISDYLPPTPPGSAIHPFIARGRLSS